jgi:hypothetical protein
VAITSRVPSAYVTSSCAISFGGPIEPVNFV